MTDLFLILLLLCLLIPAWAYPDEAAEWKVQEEWPQETLPEGIDPLDEFIHSHYALRSIEATFRGFSFLKREENVILDSDSLLAPFLQKLMELRSGLREQVSIFQFGGSHIKPGWFAEAAEKAFNQWLAEAAEPGFSPTLKFHYKGINGASFRNLLNKQEIFNLCRDLKPDLIVIAMGTNDAQGTFSAARFRTALGNFMAKLDQYRGNAIILFILPPDSYKKGVPNADVARVGAEIAAFAKAHGHVCWDLQQVMGGSGSIRNWRAGGIAQKDMVHFSAPGYRLQGQLFYEAIMRAYKRHAENYP